MNLHDPVRTHINLEDAKREFNDLFDSSVETRLDSDVAVGALLSGGLDSTSIVCNNAAKHRAVGQGFKIFSVAYENEDVSEKKYIDETIKRYPDLDAAFIYPTSAALLSDIDQIIYTHDFPIRALNVLAWHQLYHFIKDTTEVKVTFSGQGADEVFGGYKEHFNYHLIALALDEKLGSEQHYIDRYGEYDIETLQAIVNWGKKKFRQRQVQNAKPFYFTDEFSAEMPIYDDDNALRDILARNLQFSALPEFLRYEARNPMAATIESRAPFMDYRLVEWAFTLPNRLKIDNGIRKYLVREATSHEPSRTA